MNKRELLAINLNPQSIDRVRARGFTATESLQLSNLGFSMARVEAPPGWDAKKARDWLKQEFPNDRFEFNRTYQHYGAATGGDLEPPERPIPQGAGSRDCGDRCYATAAINWGPNLGTCANNVKVGVIDTAVDVALFSNRVKYASASPAGQPRAASWHGTGVLTLLSGAPQSDTPGLIPGAQFILADSFAADRDGQPVSDTASVLKALELLTAFDVKVVNMSLSGPHDEMVEKAIERLSRRGIVFVAAAGNGGPAAPPAYPAAYRQVIAVTAVNRHLNSYPYANRGDYIDVAAPGVRIWTAISKDKRQYLSGTSFAAPYVTAIVAALAGQGLKTKEAILDRLDMKDLGAPGRDPIFGRGLVIAPSSCSPGLVRSPVAATMGSWSVVRTSGSR